MSKWFWMMHYCKQNGLPPAQTWAWNKAQQAWDKEQLRLKDRKL